MYAKFVGNCKKVGHSVGDLALHPLYRFPFKQNSMLEKSKLQN